MIFKSENDVLLQIEKIANKLNLNFEINNFKFILINDYFYQIDYYLNFVNVFYKEFGMTIEERKINYNLFIESDVLNKIRKGCAGITLYQNTEKLKFIKLNFPEVYVKIEKIKTPLAIIYCNNVILNTHRFYALIFHEYLHILFRTNNIDLKNKKEDIIHIIEYLYETKTKEDYKELLEKNKDNYYIKRILKINKNDIQKKI